MKKYIIISVCWGLILCFYLGKDMGYKKCMKSLKKEAQVINVKGIEAMQSSTLIKSPLPFTIETSCCSCGLVHDYILEEDGKGILMTIIRNEERTEEERERRNIVVKTEVK